MLALPAKHMATDSSNADEHNDTVEVVRARLQKAETGQWVELFQELHVLQQAAEQDMHSQAVHSVTTDQSGEEWIFAKVAAKTKSGGLRPAKSMLLGQVTSRLDETTAAQMNGLLAAAVPESET